MAYILDFREKAINDIDFFKRTGNKVILNKIASLLDELELHPLTGTGKPEKLKYQLTGLWTRRINREHRMLYSVESDVVYIHSLKGHT